MRGLEPHSTFSKIVFGLQLNNNNWLYEVRAAMSVNSNAALLLNKNCCVEPVRIYLALGNTVSYVSVFFKQCRCGRCGLV